MIRIFMPIMVMVVGVSASLLIYVTGPKLASQPVVSLVPWVRVIETQPRTVLMSTRTHGTVIPRTESELIPEISGRVLEISPALVSGGFFRQGELLVKVDPLDYELALEQAKAGWARTESDLVNTRKTHWRQLDLANKKSTSAAQRDDALNRLRIAEASSREARVLLLKAERDLSRTHILAPYDGRVRAERVDVGQFVSRGQAIATIYAIDFAEIRLPIRDEELAFLDLPLGQEEYQPLELIQVNLRADFAGTQHEWQGQVVRTEGELDPQTRMLNVVAQVSSPYDLVNERPPLAVGLFVEAEILGRRFTDVSVLPRAALYKQNQMLIVNAVNKIEIREVEVLRISEDMVYVQNGLKAGDRVCISPLNNVIDGMLVQIATDAAG